jgi:hypothetical protein
MKHAAIMYTCIGLMGAAAVTGFVDYTHASKAGLLNDLYSEERAGTGSTLLDKEIKIDDYSRGPLEEYTPEQEQQSEIALNAQPKKLRKSKKIIAPPPVPDAPVPPAPPQLIEKNITPPLTIEMPGMITEAPVVSEIPAIEEKAETPVPPVPEVVEAKEVSFKIFSRAPLNYKKSITKRKKSR